MATMVAQMVEQSTNNPKFEGSNPAALASRRKLWKCKKRLMKLLALEENCIRDDISLKISNVKLTSSSFAI